MSVVLENHYDPKYDPTQAEVDEYGKWLGMELPKHKALLWIAREGLKAPLPDNWKACKSEKGELYYFNFKTGKSMWDHPMDQHFKDVFQEERRKLEKLENGGSGEPDGAANLLPAAAATTRANAAADAAPPRQQQLSDSDADGASGVTTTAAPAGISKRSKKRREQAISFVDGDSGAAAAAQPLPAAAASVSSTKPSHLLPAAAATMANANPPSSGLSSVDVSDDDTGATAGLPAGAKAVSSGTPGSGMGRLAQLKSLPKAAAASPSTVLPPAAAKATDAATVKSLAPLNTHKVPAAVTSNPATVVAAPLHRETSPIRAPPAATSGASAFAGSFVTPPPAATTSNTPLLTDESKKNHENALAALKLQQREEIDRVKKAHDATMAALAKSHASTVDELERAHTERVAAAKAKFEQNYLERVRALESDLERDFSNAEAKLRAMHGQRVAAAAKEMAAESTSEMQRLEAAATKGVKNHASAFAAVVTETVSKLSLLEREYSQLFQEAVVQQAVDGARQAATEAQATEKSKLTDQIGRELAAMKAQHADEVQSLAAAQAVKVAELSHVSTSVTAALEHARADRAQREAQLAAEHEVELQRIRSDYAAASSAVRAAEEARLHDIRRQLLDEYTVAEQELRRKAAAEYGAMVQAMGDNGLSTRTSLSRAPSTSVAPCGTANSASSSRATSEDAGVAAVAPPATHGSDSGSLSGTASSSAAAAMRGSKLGVDLDGKSLPSSKVPPAMLPEHLNPGADGYAPGPLSVSSANTPTAKKNDDGSEAGLSASAGGLTGESLRDAVIAVIRSLMTDAATGPVQSAPPPPLQSWPAVHNAPPPTSKGMSTDAATFMSPQANEEQHRDSASSNSSPQVDPIATGAAPRPPPPFMHDAQYHHHHPALFAHYYKPAPPAVPHSLQEQRRLIEKERERLDTAKVFLARQAAGVDRQRAALKSARSKWKKDVRLAKAAGTSATSSKAAVLRNVHALLDQQAEGLAQDEAVVRETRSWLEAKEQRLHRLEVMLASGGMADQLHQGHHAVEQGSQGGPDTTAMLAAYLQIDQPQLLLDGAAAQHAIDADDRYGYRETPVLALGSGSTAGQYGQGVGSNGSRRPSPLGQYSSGSGPAPGAGRHDSRPPTPTPAFADALLRIESRLAEVTSIVKGSHKSSSARGTGGESRSAAGSRSASAQQRFYSGDAVAPASGPHHQHRRTSSSHKTRGNVMFHADPTMLAY